MSDRRLLRRAATAAAPLLGLLFAPTGALAASGSSPPAGGAATSDIVFATVGALVVSAVLITPVLLYKAGRFPAVGRLSDLAERVTGLPGWSALPATCLVVTLLIALYGMYWDVSIHLDNGRDPGPLANTAHYFILAGLFGVLLAGVLAMALPRERTRSSVRIPILGWEAPVGALMIALCGSFSLLAFPLDDVWHRLFGQDVTLWGPTHLMLIGGAALSILGAWALHVEGVAVREREGRSLPWWTRQREIALAGALLIGLSTFQDEFDLGVPQFRLAFHPLLLMLAASVALVAARMRLGRGGALLALSQFLILRLALSILIGPIYGHTLTHVPLYLGEALAVEGVALAGFRRRLVTARPIAFGALAGAGIGTLGLAFEWGFSHVWMQIPWPASLFPEGAILGLVAAVGGGVIGGFIGRCLTPTAPRSERAPRWAVPVAALAVCAAIGWAIPMHGPSPPITAAVTTSQVTPPPHRTVRAVFHISPPAAAQSVDWLNVTNWQGHAGASTIQTLHQIAAGTFEATTPIRVYGRWKSTLRLAKGREVVGLPVFLPSDPAIPAAEVPAAAHFQRPFVLDKKNLQREQKAGVSTVLVLVAYLAVLAVYLIVIATIAWGLVRLERTVGGGGAPPAPETLRSPAPRPVPATPGATA